MHWYYGTPMGWSGFVLMLLTMILFWGGVITLVVVLLRRHDAPALRILEERLARGEIGTDEFDRVRKTLRTR
jgi:putative membrane protein